MEGNSRIRGPRKSAPWDLGAPGQPSVEPTYLSRSASWEEVGSFGPGHVKRGSQTLLLTSPGLTPGLQPPLPFSGPGSFHLEAGDPLSLPSCIVTDEEMSVLALDLGCTCPGWSSRRGWVAVDDSAPPGRLEALQSGPAGPRACVYLFPCLACALELAVKQGGINADVGGRGRKSLEGLEWEGGEGRRHSNFKEKAEW